MEMVAWLPEQVTSSFASLYPLLQLHLNPPSVLVHF